jgi:uncharacterized protein YhfF
LPAGLQENQPLTPTSFWQRYLDSLPAAHPHRGARPDAFAFGDSAPLADELAALVLAGRKRATASLAVEFTALGDPLPAAGDLSIVLRGDQTPVAIIERTEVREVPFRAVDEAFAAREGEGDGTLAGWREAHREYFTRVCARLGGAFGEDTPVLCQGFRLLWPQSGELG